MTDTNGPSGESSGSGGWAGQETAGNATPADQITQSLKTVNDALHAAGARLATTSQEVGMCAIKQAEQNAQALFETLRAMAASRDPKQVTELYTRFVSDSAKSHADQLREMGEIMARTSRAAWAPITDVIARQTSPKT